METRDQTNRLHGQFATILSELARMIAVERPGDADLQESAVNRLTSLETLLHDAQSGSTPPADAGDADRVGLGPTAPGDIGEVFAPAAVAPYDEAVSSERLLAVGDLYYCYQHERLGMFRAVWKLQELFKAGKIRLASGAGAFGLYRFDLKQVLRYTHRQRMQAYRRVLGYTDAPPPTGARSNDTFHGLLTRFCTHLAQLFRDKRVAEVVRGTGSGPDPSFGSIAMVRRSGLDLRSNLKAAAYGDVGVLTVELLQLLNTAFAILGADDVMRQFGSDNAWDTLEEVLERHLNERPAASQRSRMGTTGREIIRWLAQSHILADGRTQFEASAWHIGEDAEEWLTSAHSLGLSLPPAAERGDKVVRLYPRARLATA